MADKKESTGEKIRRIRIERNLTQKQLGELCGMYESQIRKYETGKANPKIETLGKIAKALSIDTNTLRSDLELDFESIGNSINLYFDSVQSNIIRENDIILNIRKLNDLGRDEAAKRIEELTHIEKYVIKNEEDKN